MNVMGYPAWKVAMAAAAVGGLVAVSLLWRGTSLEAVKPVYGPAIEAIYATGNVEATQTISVAPRTSARLFSLLADEGDVVAEGDVLGTMEAGDVDASVRQLQAREAYARANLKRLSSLVGSLAVSKDAYDAAKAEAAAALAALKQAQAQQGFTRLLAPVASTVVQRDGEPGTFISAGTPVFWLAAGPLRITAQVDEEDIPRVKEGQTVLIRSDNLPGEVISGTVASITPRGDALSRSFRVRVNVPETEGLRIGMTTEINIILHQNDNAMLVPTAAMNGSKVWIVKDGEAQLQSVKVGSSGISLTEIVEGLTPESVVLTKPPEDLKPGQNVHVRLQQAKVP